MLKTYLTHIWNKCYIKKKIENLITFCFKTYSTMPPMPPLLFCYHASLLYGGANMFLWKAMDTFVCEFQNNILQLNKLFCLQRDWTKCYLCDCVYCQNIHDIWLIDLLSCTSNENVVYLGSFTPIQSSKADFFSQPHRWKVNLTWGKKKEALVFKRYHIDMWAYCKQKW